MSSLVFLLEKFMFLWKSLCIWFLFLSLCYTMNYTMLVNQYVHVHVAQGICMDTTHQPVVDSPVEVIRDSWHTDQDQYSPSHPMSSLIFLCLSPLYLPSFPPSLLSSIPPSSSPSFLTPNISFSFPPSLSWYLPASYSNSWWGSVLWALQTWSQADHECTFSGQDGEYKEQP